MADKQFIGKVTEKTFSNGGSILKLSLSPTDLQNVNSGGWLNINIQKSAKGNWYGTLDTWQPSGNGRAQQAAPQAPQDTPQDGGIAPYDDLPFNHSAFDI